VEDPVQNEWTVFTYSTFNNAYYLAYNQITEINETVYFKVGAFNEYGFGPNSTIISLTYSVPNKPL